LTDTEREARNQYEENGYEDDAMILTPALLKHIQETYNGQGVEVFDVEEVEELEVDDLGDAHL